MNNPKIYKTSRGTQYFCEPGIALISAPTFNLREVDNFCESFGGAFDNYTDDPCPRGCAAGLIKFAGQVCYLSLGEKRTMNADAARYFDNILSSGHGSVLEHATFSFLLWGISRSLTHELVRHRTGTAFSQVSQRYVNNSVLRFVERPEWQTCPDLHAAFVKRIDEAAYLYETLTCTLLARLPEGGTNRDRRKAVQQASRSLLPNETEAPMVFSANVRALRHIIEMRGSKHAEPEIRLLAHRLLMLMKNVEPLLFADYSIDNGDVLTNWRKV
jgi:thymidylate synthase (FAD)